MEEKGSKGKPVRPKVARTPAATTRKAAAPKKAAGSRAPTTKASTASARPAAERAEMVRVAAYFRAERRGFAPGYEIEDWLAAEAEVAGRAPGANGARTPRKGSPRKPRAD